MAVFFIIFCFATLLDFNCFARGDVPLIRNLEHNSSKSFHRIIIRKNVTHIRNATLVSTTISPSQKEFSEVAADAGIAIIILVVVSTIFLMAIYFIRKFDQLNRTVPSYRYSALKTEVNGVLGGDDKIESQALVSESTEEEEDFDDGDEVSMPPTLLVQSQTTVSNSKSESDIPAQKHMIPKLLITAEDIKEIITIDSDDELLQ